MGNSNHTDKVKKSPRFGVLDAVIILLVIAAVLGIYFRYQLIDWITNTRNMKEYTVTFAIDDIRYTTPNYLNIGDEVYFASSGDRLGTLIEESDDASNSALSTVPALKTVYIDGVPYEIQYPNNESRADVKGRLRCTGSYSEDGGLLINGSTYIAPGQTVSSKTEWVTVDLRILAIEAVE